MGRLEAGQLSYRFPLDTICTRQSEAQNTYIYRVQSSVWRFRTIDPSPPIHPASVSYLRSKVGGYSPGGEGVVVWWVNISEDARHLIGLLQYNPSTVRYSPLSVYLSPISSPIPTLKGVLSHKMNNFVKDCYFKLILFVYMLLRSFRRGILFCFVELGNPSQNLSGSNFEQGNTSRKPPMTWKTCSEIRA